MSMRDRKRELEHEFLQEGFTYVEAKCRAIDELRKDSYHNSTFPLEYAVNVPVKTEDTLEGWILSKKVLAKIKREKSKKERRRLRALFLSYLKSIDWYYCYDLFSEKEVEKVIPPDANARRLHGKTYTKWFTRKEWAKRKYIPDMEIMNSCGEFPKKYGTTADFKRSKKRLQEIVREVINGK